MRRLFLFLSLLVTIPVLAATKDLTRLDTRYGLIDTVERADTTTVRFRGKAVGMLPAFGASLYRIASAGKREFVIVDGWTPGLHCHHVFLLVELFDDGNAAASKPFGECKELQGTEIRGDVPVVHLGEPYIPERGQSLALTDFEWKNGAMVQVSGPVPGRGAAQAPKKPAVEARTPVAPVPVPAPVRAPVPPPPPPPPLPAPKPVVPAKAASEAPPKIAILVTTPKPGPAPAPIPAKPENRCAAATDAAKAGSTTVDAGHRAAKVSGQGRLPFFAAPAAGCEQPGIFIVTGDAVQVERRFGEYAFVRYVNPKNGKAVQGWVANGRLGAP